MLVYVPPSIHFDHINTFLVDVKDDSVLACAKTIFTISPREWFYISFRNIFYAL
jgi:hypothetical protein